MGLNTELSYLANVENAEITESGHPLLIGIRIYLRLIRMLLSHLRVKGASY